MHQQFISQKCNLKNNNPRKSRFQDFSMESDTSLPYAWWCIWRGIVYVEDAAVDVDVWFESDA